MTLGITIICYNAECHYAECLDIFIVMLNVIMLSVVILNVIMLSVVMMNVVILSVVMLNVVVPRWMCYKLNVFIFIMSEMATHCLPHSFFISSLPSLLNRKYFDTFIENHSVDLKYFYSSKH